MSVDGVKTREGEGDEAVEGGERQTRDVLQVCACEGRKGPAALLMQLNVACDVDKGAQIKGVEGHERHE